MIFKVKAVILSTLLSLTISSCGIELYKRDEDPKKKEREMLNQNIAEMEKKAAFDLTDEAESCSVAESVRQSASDDSDDPLEIRSCNLNDRKLTIVLIKNSQQFDAVFDMTGKTSLLPYVREQNEIFQSSFEAFVLLMESKIGSSIRYPVTKQ